MTELSPFRVDTLTPNEQLTLLRNIVVSAFVNTLTTSEQRTLLHKVVAAHHAAPTSIQRIIADAHNPKD
jgi:hypothetical protein